jgi:hypothetical protein
MASWAKTASSATYKAHGEVTPTLGDPKPRQRLRANQREWELLREFFENECCCACGLREPLSLHHVVPKSQGGDDVRENLVVLCGDGTRGCHGKLENHEPGWERVAGHVRAYVQARESRLRYVLDRIGQARFDSRYPCPPFLAIGDLDRYGSPDPWLRENRDEI